MEIGSKILLVLLATVVIGGAVYILRPEPDIDLSTSATTPLSSPVDDTVPFPPKPTQAVKITPIAQDVNITLNTNQGDIALTLHGVDAPFTVGNFVKLAQEDFYDKTTFHRVIPDFMIQGGDPFSRDPAQRARHGTGGPGYTFGDEINARKVVRGVIAMANAGPSTNGSQFFIVTGPAFPQLDGKHTVFGEVTAGMEIVDAISNVARDTNDNPTAQIIIQDVVVHNAPVDPQSALKPLP